MRSRVAGLLGARDHRRFMPFMGTFHRICVELLRQDGEHIGLARDFVIFDQQDASAAMARALKQTHTDPKKFAPRSVLSVVSSNKNELIGLADFAGFATTPLAKVAVKTWPIYQRILTEASALDFDDILLKAVELLANHRELRQKWQRQFKYVMVDEYQDTNAVQYKLIKLLCGTKQNLCVVGDDWQSIYSWRGADFRNILNFERDYPRAVVIKLEQNYRSTEAILTAAHQVVSKNNQRSDKKLWTDNLGGSPVHVLIATDEVAEAEAVIRTVKIAANLGQSYREFAVLYRTNAQSRSLEEQFIRYGLPYRVVGGVRFYDRKEIKDLLAYLRLLYQPDDLTSYERVINVPTRGLGAVSLTKFDQWRQTAGLSLSRALASLPAGIISPRAEQALKGFNQLMNELRSQINLSVAELVDIVIKKIDYLAYLSDGSVQGESRVENVKELASVAKEYDADLAEFLEEVSLISDIDSYDTAAEAVTLMTLHAAKGLEFPVVFIVGLEEGVFPHSRALFDAQEMEEERRLCYVGMTRAMKDLYLIHATRRLLYGSVQHNPPSRFIGDINNAEQVSTFSLESNVQEPVFVPDELPNLFAGDRVRHPVFGDGVVASVAGDMATVKFGRVSKTLNLAFALLEKLS